MAWQPLDQRRDDDAATSNLGPVPPTASTHWREKMEKSNRYLPLLGRILIGAPFILSGLGKLAAHDATVGYIGSVGLPFPQLGWLIAMAAEIGGGALLLLGYRGRAVALVMALFTLATA